MNILIRTCSLLLLVPLLSLFGCSYGHYADTKQEFARTESVRMQSMGPVVMEALALILKQLNGSNGDDYLLNHVYYDEQGRKNELKVKDGSKSSMAALVSMQFLPVLEKIYVQQQLQMEAPPTAEGIALAGIKVLPALAAIWGFADLGGGTGDSNSNNSTVNTTNTDNSDNSSDTTTQ